MDYYGRYKYKSPSKRRREILRKCKFPSQFRVDPILVLIPVCRSNAFPTSCPVSDPDMVTVNTRHLAIKRLKIEQDEMHQVM